MWKKILKLEFGPKDQWYVVGTAVACGGDPLEGDPLEGDHVAPTAHIVVFTNFLLCWTVLATLYSGRVF